MRTTVRNIVHGAALLAACTLPCFSQESSSVRPSFYPVNSNKAGDIYTVAGNGTVGSGGDSNSAVEAFLNSPQAVAFDAEGNVFISDTGNNVIRKVSSVTGVITTYAGGGVCVPATTRYCGDGGPATKASLLQPMGLAFDANGDLNFADSGNNVVRKVSTKTGIITTVAGDGTQGASDGGGNPTQAELWDPVSIAFDQSGNLYIDDADNFLIRKVASNGKAISTFAGGGTGCTGQSDSIGDNCPAIEANLERPYWITFDSMGNLYIAQPTTSGGALVGRIRMINSNGLITTYAGGGSGCAGTDSVNDGCPINEINVYATSLSSSPTGDLYLSVSNPDGVPCAIQYIHDLTLAATVGNQASGFRCGYSGDGGPALSAQIAQLTGGLAFDPLGNLYVADSTNNRIREVINNVPPTTTAPTFSLESGIYFGKQTLKLKDTEPTAVIFYTTDGSQATPLSRQYSGPITVSVTTTIDAIAVVPEYFPSSSVKEKFTIDELRTGTPVISPAGLTSGEEVVVTITSHTAGSKLHYTTDGTTPTASSPLYNKPISVTTPETIEAIAIAPNDAQSVIASETYTIAGAPTALSAAPSGITKSSAALNAAINSLGVAVHYYFEYGTSASELGSTTETRTLGASDTSKPVTAQITGLKAAKTYYYRVVATSIGGTSASAVIKFTTE